MEAKALRRFCAHRPKAPTVVVAVVSLALATLLCVCATHQSAYAEETYTVTFGDTGRSYQVPAGKTLGDVKGASIPKLADTTYTLEGWDLRNSKSKLDATFMGWACELVDDDGSRYDLDALGAEEPGGSGWERGGGGSSGGVTELCGIISYDQASKLLYSRDGWRNAKGKLGYEPFSLSTKVTFDLTVWAVYSVPICRVNEGWVRQYVDGFGSSGEIFFCVKTGVPFSTSSMSDPRITAMVNGAGEERFLSRAPYFWKVEPAVALEKSVTFTKDGSIFWWHTYDKSKRHPELSYAAKSIKKTFGAKPFVNKLISITDGALAFASSNKKVATVGKDGKVAIRGVGKTTVSVTSKRTFQHVVMSGENWQPGTYIDYTHEAGKASYTLTVNPKGTSVKKLVKGKKSFTISWKKPTKASLKQITGYQVKYSLKKSMKSAKTKTVKASSKAGKKCSLTVSKLKGGKKYYVQVRTYKKTGKTTYYSDWSKTKTVKTKK